MHVCVGGVCVCMRIAVHTCARCLLGLQTVISTSMCGFQDASQNPYDLSRSPLSPLLVKEIRI